MPKIGRFLRSSVIPTGYWVTGDETYTIEGCLMTPFRKSFLTTYTDSYNFYHSSQPVHIEQAFGMHVSKCRMLKSPLMFSLSANSQTVICAAKLHNFCIKFSESGEENQVPSHLMNAAVEQLDKWLLLQSDVIDNDAALEKYITSGEGGDGLRRALDCSRMRHDQVRILQRYALLRPKWARPRYNEV